jgi:hypothetical protein
MGGTLCEGINCDPGSAGGVSVSEYSAHACAEERGIWGRGGGEGVAMGGTLCGGISCDPGFAGGANVSENDAAGGG